MPLTEKNCPGAFQQTRCAVLLALPFGQPLAAWLGRVDKLALVLLASWKTKLYP
jgi:hypothetical protein